MRQDALILSQETNDTDTRMIYAPSHATGLLIMPTVRPAIPGKVSMGLITETASRDHSNGMLEQHSLFTFQRAWHVWSLGSALVQWCCCFCPEGHAPAVWAS